MKRVKYVENLSVGCLALLTLLSCVTTAPQETIKIEPKYYIIPKVGVESISYIGDTLLKEGHTTSQDAIFLKSNHGTRGWTTFHPSGAYKLVGKTDGALIYQYPELEPTGWGSVYPQIIEDPDGRVYLKTNSGRELLEKSEYTKKKVVQDTDDYEQQLIYIGARGTVLKFTYREFVNDMARPAFTIESTYDIKDDKIIRFKGASLEVIEVDNQSITYILISGFKSN